MLLKIIANALLFLFIASYAYAGSGTVGLMAAGGSATAVCNYTVCGAGCKLFDWDCSTANMSSNVCSVGDNTATLTGEADLTTNAGKITLLDTSDNGNDRYVFDMSSYDLFPAGSFTLEITINMSVIANSATIFQMYLDASNYFQISFSTAAGNDVVFTHNGNGTTVTKTFDVNLNTAQEYVIRAKCGTTSGMALSVDGGTSYTTDATKTITTMTHSGTASGVFKIGTAGVANLEGTIDNVRVYYGWRTDI